MKFLMDCQLTLSKDIPGVDIKSLLAKIGDLLDKGASPGTGAKIEKESVSGDKILLTISSGRFVRPHDALFRIKNYLAQHLGKQLGAGRACHRGQTGRRGVLGRSDDGHRPGL